MAVHWKVQGDWHFDAQFWPDPSAMVREINGLGMEVMVTVWPFSHNGSLSCTMVTLSRLLASALRLANLEGLIMSCVPCRRQAAGEWLADADRERERAGAPELPTQQPLPSGRGDAT